MRVIAGEVRGRKLVAPAGLATRPTADRVRQSLFDMIAVRWTGGKALDLFAGSGALGIEALSRGADEAIFVDQHAAALKALETNLAACRFAERAQVVRGDFRTALRKLAAEGRRFDLVFIDPPYEGGMRDAAAAAATAVLAPGALVAVETADTEPPFTAPAGWTLEAERKYGRTLIYLYRYGANG